MKRKLLLYFVLFLLMSSFSVEAQEMTEEIDPMCILAPDPGPCRGAITMYFFEPTNKSCNTFAWGGCQGNGNRFDSHRDCRRTCIKRRAKYQPPIFCSLTYDYGWCFGAEHRYYYDKRWKVCKSAIWSGCGGNKNNFQSFEQCEQVCRFGLEPLLSSDQMRGKKGGNYLIVNPNPDKYEIVRLSSTTETPTTTTEPPSTRKIQLVFGSHDEDDDIDSDDHKKPKKRKMKAYSFNKQ